MKVSSIKTIIFYYFILSFSIILYDFCNDKLQSYFMLSILYVAPFLYLLNLYKFIKIQYSFYLITFAAFILFDALINIETFRFSTIAYSYMFIFSYLYYAGIVDSMKINRSKVIKFLSLIIKAFAIVLIIQQVSTVAHITVFNHGWLSDSEYKWNSLSNEPSYIAQTLTIIIYTIIKLREQVKGYKLSLMEQIRADKVLWFCYLYTSFTCFSVSCIIAPVLLLFYYFSWKKVVQWLVLSMVLMYIITLFVSPKIIERITDLFAVIWTFDPDLIYIEDPSSSARIIPFIYYIRELDLSNFHLWFGYGCDYADNHWIDLVFSGHSETNQGIGGIINNLYDYGVLPFIFYFKYLTKLIHVKSYEMFLYITLFFIFDINMYITWLFFMMIYLINRCSRQKTPMSMACTK